MRGESAHLPEIKHLDRNCLGSFDQVLHEPREGQLIDLELVHPSMREHISQIRITEINKDGLHVDVHVLHDDEPEEEIAGDGDAETVAFQMWSLPARQFNGLWETLEFDEDTPVKERLLRYISTSMRFSACSVNSNIIPCNRVVLLHGPPGTGKTSISKALAQKLAIRNLQKYQHTYLIEVNAHSLFSKWFSESGKMVMGMFSRITEILEDDDSFVCVLIDEVESLSAARESALSGNEPSDSLRVVNALLTQLDGLKRFANALVLATSNLTGAIDAAFLDRADIKQYIGPPSTSARYSILASCIRELISKQILSTARTYKSGGPLMTWDAVLRILPPTECREFNMFANLPMIEENEDCIYSMMLYSLAQECEGFSGRSLRKLPFTACALFMEQDSGGEFDIHHFLRGMRGAIQYEIQCRRDLDQ